MFVVERRDHFLLIETKALDEPLTQGQRILLCAFSRLPRCTAVVLYGQKGWPEVIQRIENGELLDIEQTSREDFQRRIDAWYGKVNAARP